MSLFLIVVPVLFFRSHVHNANVNAVQGCLSNGFAWKALFNAFTQSEQGPIYALRDRSMNKKLAAALVIHTVVCARMIQAGWRAGYYIAASRIGNTFMWSVIGPEGLAGARHHELHHACRSVPDSDSPKLSAWAQEVETEITPQNVIVFNNLQCVQVAL